MDRATGVRRAAPLSSRWRIRAAALGGRRSSAGTSAVTMAQVAASCRSTRVSDARRAGVCRRRNAVEPGEGFPAAAAGLRGRRWPPGRRSPHSGAGGGAVPEAIGIAEQGKHRNSVLLQTLVETARGSRGRASAAVLITIGACRGLPQQNQPPLGLVPQHPWRRRRGVRARGAARRRAAPGPASPSQCRLFAQGPVVLDAAHGDHRVGVVPAGRSRRTPPPRRSDFWARPVQLDVARRGEGPAVFLFAVAGAAEGNERGRAAACTGPG